MLWFSSELKSGERMLMICRENEARPDESPAKVFITQRNLERDGGEGEGVRMEKWRGVGWSKGDPNGAETGKNSSEGRHL